MLNENWNHTSVFKELAERGNRTKNTSLNPPYYVVLYPQTLNAALLYDESVSVPIHIHKSRVDGEVWSKIKSSLEYVRSDNKGPAMEAQNFEHYRVKDWNGFAKGLGL